jgi:hypothetical protein
MMLHSKTLGGLSFMNILEWLVATPIQVKKNVMLFNSFSFGWGDDFIQVLSLL